MIISDIPLQSLKDILASDTPLAIQTTEALIARLEQAERALEATERQVAARSGETAAERIWRGRAEKAEQAIKRVRELVESWDVDAFVYDSNPLNGTLTINVSDAAKHVARALDGDTRG